MIGSLLDNIGDTSVDVLEIGFQDGLDLGVGRVVDEEPLFAVLLLITHHAKKVTVGGVIGIAAGGQLSRLDSDGADNGMTCGNGVFDGVNIEIVDVGVIPKLTGVGYVKCPVAEFSCAVVTHTPGNVCDVKALFAVVQKDHGQGGGGADTAADLGDVHLPSDK